MIKLALKRNFALSLRRSARGTSEEKAVYASNPYLPAKRASARITPAHRKQVQEWDKELELIQQMDLMNLNIQNLEISKMLNRELEGYCTKIITEEKSQEQIILEEKNAFEEDLKYFYFWTVEGHFFGLLDSVSNFRDACTEYSLNDEDDPGFQSQISAKMNHYRYTSKVIRAKWNLDENTLIGGEDTFFGKHFENILIRISSIWIAKNGGMIFFHFVPTFRMSLILQLSVESSQICSVLQSHPTNQEDQLDHNLPSYLSANQNLYLIKVPLSKTSNLKLYAQVKSDDIGEEEHRNLWRKNPVTSTIVDSVYAKN